MILSGVYDINYSRCQYDLSNGVIVTDRINSLFYVLTLLHFVTQPENVAALRAASIEGRGGYGQSGLATVDSL